MTHSDPPLPETFLQFLQGGTFGGVGIGQTLQEVQQLLGQATATQQFDTMLSVRWASLPAELHFDTDTGMLWWMDLDLQQPRALFRDLPGVCPDRVGEYLNAHGIPFTEHRTPDPDAPIEYHLPHAITFQFCAAPDATSPLHLCGVSQSQSLLPYLVHTAP